MGRRAAPVPWGGRHGGLRARNMCATLSPVHLPKGDSIFGAAIYPANVTTLFATCDALPASRRAHGLAIRCRGRLFPAPLRPAALRCAGTAARLALHTFLPLPLPFIPSTTYAACLPTMPPFLLLHSTCALRLTPTPPHPTICQRSPVQASPTGAGSAHAFAGISPATELPKTLPLPHAPHPRRTLPYRCAAVQRPAGRTGAGHLRLRFAGVLRTFWTTVTGGLVCWDAACARTVLPTLAVHTTITPGCHLLDAVWARRTNAAAF